MITATHSCWSSHHNLATRLLLSEGSIDGIYYDPNIGWYAGTEQKGTHVEFCPFCGVRLEMLTPKPTEAD